jgi:cytosine/adenosine deaminase-related metal-dependent hydrolase
MMNEARQALLLNRLGVAPGLGSGPQMTARQALRLATVGGARVLSRDDIGRLAPGLCADLVAFDLNRIQFAGAVHDPVAAMVMCAPVTVDHSWVGGRRVVEDGHLVGLDTAALIEEHNRLAGTLN